jgi:transposase
MIQPDVAKWGQTPDDLRQLAISASHERSRERYQALYEIGCGAMNASEWAGVMQRQPRTVLGWVHNYNQAGPAGVLYRHSGGRSKRLTENEQAQLIETVLTSTPAVHELPGYG